MPRRGDGFVDSRAKKSKKREKKDKEDGDSKADKKDKKDKEKKNGGFWSCCSSGEVAPKEKIETQEKKKKDKDKKSKKDGATASTEEPNSEGSDGTAVATTNRSESPVKVMNLADLPSGSKFPSPGVDDEEGGFTARTGASFASRAPRRNPYDDDDCQSVGGQSMASVKSVAVQKYSDIISGPKKSSAEMKQLVKDFVKEMVKGKELKVIRADGQLKGVMCGVARALDTFKIKAGNQVRKIPLRTIDRVLLGDASEELDDLETPLDEKCSTLELDSGECISFKFPNTKKAEEFTLCLTMFTDNQKKK